MTDWNGINIAAVNTRNNIWLVFVLFLTISQAVTADTSTMTVTATTVMSSVLNSDGPRSICSAALFRYLRFYDFGNAIGDATISFWLLNEFTNKKYMGNTV